MRTPLLSLAQVEAAKKAAASGKPHGDIAASLRVSMSTIKKVLSGCYRAKEDAPKKQRRVPIEVKREIHQRAKGTTHAAMLALAVEYDLAVTTVRSYAQRDPDEMLRRSTYAAPRMKVLPANNMELPRHFCEPYGTKQSIASCVARATSGLAHSRACQGCGEGEKNKRTLRRLGVNSGR